MTRVMRTVVVRSVKLSRKVFRIFVELEGMYRNMLEQLVLYASKNLIWSFTKLKSLKYRELRAMYPQLPSHYAYTACQDAATRVKSFYRCKVNQLAEEIFEKSAKGLRGGVKKLRRGEKRYLYRRAYMEARRRVEKEMREGRLKPEVRKATIWLDDHLWKLDSLTSIKITTHKGWILVGFEPHKHYWRYVNRGWQFASEIKVRLDRRKRQLVIYLTFVKNVEECKARGFLPVDVNENNVTILIDDKPYLLETDIEKIVLGYYYRRKRIQEKYDELYGKKSRIKRKIMRKLKERKKKLDVRRKIANLIVKVVYENRCVIVLEKLGKRAANNMLTRIKDKQLRHRIFQAGFKGVQKAMEKKAKEYGVPVIYVDPKDTSKTCPIHNAPITYKNGSRIGKCSKGGELWHRDVVACWNLLLKALQGDGSNAPSPVGRVFLDGSLVPLGSTATHDPITLPKGLWARWKSLLLTRINTKTTKMMQKG